MLWVMRIKSAFAHTLQVGPGDNSGWDIDAVTLIAPKRDINHHLLRIWGVLGAERARYAAFKLNLRRGATVDNVLTVTPQGYLGVGLGGLQNPVVRSPGFNLDLTSYQDVVGTSNTLAAFSYQRSGGVPSKTWTVGIDRTFPGMGKTIDPFVIGRKEQQECYKSTRHP